MGRRDKRRKEVLKVEVSILGTQYKIEIKKYEEDEAFERRSISGYCDGYTKNIVICDMATYVGWEHEPPESCAKAQAETIRHEIIHAFFNESGLKDSAFAYDGSWTKNEEMIDWLAIQLPKIYEAFESVGCM